MTNGVTGVGTSWWGDFDVGENGLGYWRIGPLELWVSNARFEWRVYSQRGDDPLDISLSLRVPCRDEPPDTAEVVRFSFLKPGERLSLRPRLADRAVVVKPELSFFVPPGEQATLFVSTPLWVELSLEGGGKLLELPTYRLSDTWFGSSTLVGEFCYASRTAGRLDLERLEPRPHRAVTPIRVQNRADTPLRLERIKLPVQYLSVYSSSRGGLWTEQVTLRREEDGDLAELQLGRVPAEAGTTKKLSEPRQRAERNLVVRAFSKLFRHE